MRKSGLQLNLVISVFLGLSLAYFITSLFFYHFVSETGVRITLRSNSKLRASSVNYIDAILDSNLFGINVAETRIVSTKKPIKKIDALEGYRLVGVVTGKDPMVLLKKGNKPVEIVTKKRLLLGEWRLEKIHEKAVILKNIRSGKLVRFELKQLKNASSSGIALTSFSFESRSRNVKKVRLRKREVLTASSNLGVLMTKLNLSPYSKDGKLVGYRVNWVAPKSLFDRVGLRRGDIIVRINGEKVTDVSKLLAMYSNINNVSVVTIDIIRRGKRETLLVELE